MEIRPEIAFQEAMEEISILNERIVVQRCMIKQLEEEIMRLKEEQENKEE